jgi:hypothetical protein
MKEYHYLDMGKGQAGLAAMTPGEQLCDGRSRGMTPKEITRELAADIRLSQVVIKCTDSAFLGELRLSFSGGLQFRDVRIEATTIDVVGLSITMSKIILLPMWMAMIQFIGQIGWEPYSISPVGAVYFRMEYEIAE